VSSSRAVIPIARAVDEQVGRLTRNPEVQATMSAYVTLTAVFGKGIHTLYGDIKRRHKDRQKKKRQRRAQDDEGHSSLSLLEPSPQAYCIRLRRGYRKWSPHTRRHNDHSEHHYRGDENIHRREHNPDQHHSEVHLGISSEARASAEARASRSARQHTYHQRERDIGVALSLREVHHMNLLELREEATDAPPGYVRDAPRRPSYENCTFTSQNRPFRRLSNLGSEYCTNTLQAPQLVREIAAEEVWWGDTTFEGGSDTSTFASRTGYGNSDIRPALPPPY
jgi:hypothetical protein